MFHFKPEERAFSHFISFQILFFWIKCLNQTWRGLNIVFCYCPILLSCLVMNNVCLNQIKLRLHLTILLDSILHSTSITNARTPSLIPWCIIIEVISFQIFIEFHNSFPSESIKWDVTHTYPHKPLRKIKVTIYASTWLTADLLCGLTSNLVICMFRKSMVIHDIKFSYWDQVSSNNTNQTKPIHNAHNAVWKQSMKQQCIWGILQCVFEICNVIWEIWSTYFTVQKSHYPPGKQDASHV